MKKIFYGRMYSSSIYMMLCLPEPNFIFLLLFIFSFFFNYYLFDNCNYIFYCYANCKLKVKYDHYFEKVLFVFSLKLSTYIGIIICNHQMNKTRPFGHEIFLILLYLVFSLCKNFISLIQRLH